MKKNPEMMRVIILVLCVGLCRTEQVLTCSRPSLTGGLVVPQKDIYDNGFSAYMVCWNYLKPVSSLKEIRCQDGFWTPTPDCEGKCSTPQVANAQEVTQLFEQYPAGARVEFKCTEGFEFKKGSFAECVAGQWVLPECNRYLNSCDPPAPVANTVVAGQFQNVYEEGDKITYKCNQGYRLIGDQIRTCSNSQWSHAPICIKFAFSPGKPPVGPSSGKTQVSACGPPPEFLDGDVTEKADGMALIAHCSKFYKLEGPKEIYCINNEWSEQPICKSPCVLDPNIKLIRYRERFLEDGMIIQDRCDTFSRIQVKCINGKAIYNGCGHNDW